DSARALNWDADQTPTGIPGDMREHVGRLVEQRGRLWITARLLGLKCSVDALQEAVRGVRDPSDALERHVDAVLNSADKLLLQIDEGIKEVGASLENFRRDAAQVARTTLEELIEFLLNESAELARAESILLSKQAD